MLLTSTFASSSLGSRLASLGVVDSVDAVVSLTGCAAPSAMVCCLGGWVVRLVPSEVEGWLGLP